MQMVAMATILIVWYNEDGCHIASDQEADV